MDAQPTDIEPERRTRMRRIEPNSEIENLRTGMLQTENRIVEDIETLLELLQPERVADHVIAIVKEELSLRLKAVDRQKLVYRIKNEVKGRPYLFIPIGLGVIGLILYGLMPEDKNGMVVEHRLTAKPETIPTEPPFREHEAEYPAASPRV